MPDPYEIIGLASNPFSVFAILFRSGVLVIFFPIIVKMAWQVWYYYVVTTYVVKRERVLLAIDVPKMTEQSMKAVEQIVVAMHGVHFNPNKKEKYWLGVVQDNFVLEIVSIDGYIQYFIRCDTYNVDLVKGSIFAQYPDAEIIEVEDYVDNVPSTYPDEKYDMFGAQFVLTKPDPYPLKTYEYFEHKLTGVYADPLSALLELLSRIDPGEQIWLQMVLTPVGPDFRDACLAEVDSLLGRRPPGTISRMSKVAAAPFRAIQLFLDGLANRELTPPPEAVVDEGSDGNFLNMTTNEKLVVEEIQKKSTRRHFSVNFRFLYIFPKERNNTWRIVGSVFGALKQFNTLDMNGFTLSGKTATSGPTWLFTKARSKWRKNSIMSAYRGRSNWVGDSGFVLSDVEIASVYHFPLETTRAPLVSKTESKKAEPPSRLPFEVTDVNPERPGYQRVLVQQEPAPVDLPTESEPEEVSPELPSTDVPKQVALPPAAPEQTTREPLSPQNVVQRAREAIPGVVLKDSHGKVLSEINMADQPGTDFSNGAVQSGGSQSQMNTAISAPPQPVTPPPSQVQAPPQPAAQPYPMHSMPGLPPGVHPVDPNQEVAERPAQPVPQQYPPQPVMQQGVPDHGTIPAQEGNQSKTPPPNLPV